MREWIKLLISLLFATGDKIWLSILSKRMLKMKLLDTALRTVTLIETFS